MGKILKTSKLAPAFLFLQIQFFCDRFPGWGWYAPTSGARVNAPFLRIGGALTTIGHDSILGDGALTTIGHGSRSFVTKWYALPSPRPVHPGEIVRV